MASTATPPVQAPAPVSRHGGLRAGLAARGTPSLIAGWMAALVLLSLAWGAVAAWAVEQHSSAASSLANADAPYSFDAQQLYLALAHADVTITSAFLADSQPLAPGMSAPSTLAARQQFDSDVTTAGRYLAALKDSSGSPAFTAAVARIVGGLPRYEGHVHDALSQYTQGFIPTGDSFTQVASEDAHLALLPDAKLVYQYENAAVTASKNQATSLPAIVGALLVAVAALAALLRAQRWLTRRTRRVLNPGLVIATVALVISGGWLAVTFGIAGADLSTAIGQGANPAGWLAQASIDVQQARGDSIVNVIARSGSTALPADAASQAASVGPGRGSLLDMAQAAGNAQVTPLADAALSAAPAWYAVNNQGYTFGSQHDYAREQTSVLRTASAGYASVENDIGTALGAAQRTFTSNAAAGASDFGSLEAIVIAASLLMAAASAGGLYRRLREYL
jgi:hypothetical protein